jgi:hypothetical protein
VKPEDSGGFSSSSEQRLQQLTQRCTYMFRVAATLSPGRLIRLGTIYVYGSRRLACFHAGKIPADLATSC